MKMKLILCLLVLGLLLVGSVSAMVVNFYYNPSCSHCNKVLPLISEISKDHKINFIDISQGSYNVQDVPTIKIKTDDGREIKLIGSQQIPRWLGCELKEQSNLNCPTYSAKEGFNPETNSWFVR